MVPYSLVVARLRVQREIRREGGWRRGTRTVATSELVPGKRRRRTGGVLRNRVACDVRRGKTFRRNGTRLRFRPR